MEKSLLDYLRSKSTIDCDTLDDEVARKLGPFADCTSNQAIAYSQVCKDMALLSSEIELAKEVHPRYQGITIEELVVDIIVRLATTLFTFEQAALAGEVGCTYIAPYVNDLRVHFIPGFIDSRKDPALGFLAQKYYSEHNHHTKVLAASLTSVEEVMSLAGLDHITISAPLLEQLAVLTSKNEMEEYPTAEKLAGSRNSRKLDLLDNEKEFQKSLQEENEGNGKEKLESAIELFSEMQQKLEELVLGELTKMG